MSPEPVWLVDDALAPSLESIEIENVTDRIEVKEEIVALESPPPDQPFDDDQLARSHIVRGFEAIRKGLYDQAEWEFEQAHDLADNVDIVRMAQAQLEELGVPPPKIKREFYGPPADVTQEPGWPEGVAADTLFTVAVVGRETVRAPAGEPLLNTLERYSIVVPAVCRSGACSACRARLLSGKVFQPAHTALRESDRELGYLFTPPPAPG